MTTGRPLLPRAAFFALAVGASFAPIAITLAQAAPAPGLRPLGLKLATARGRLGEVTDLRELSDGRVLVNDATRHEVRLYDEALGTSAIVAHGANGANGSNAYGPYEGALIAARGDTTLFVDIAARVLRVVDARGVMSGIVSVPRPGDLGSLLRRSDGGGAFDAAGRLIYRITGVGIARDGQLTQHSAAWAFEPAPPTGTARIDRDHTVLVRLDVTTGRFDTLGTLVAESHYRAAESRPGAHDGGMWVNPFQVTDGWATVSDGSIALVRGQDYHVDWVNADGTRTSTPPIAVDRLRVSAEEKGAVVDSVRRALDPRMEMHGDSVHWLDPSIQYWIGHPVIQASLLRNARPPFDNMRSVRADAENNLWILESGTGSRDRQLTGAPPTPEVYDVVNRRGLLIDRVQLPRGLRLVGFGHDVAYVVSGDPGKVVLMKYRLP